MAYVFAAMILIFFIGLLLGSIIAIVNFIREREYALASMGILLLCGFVGVIGLGFMYA